MKLGLPPPPIHTKDEALRWLVSMVEEAEDARTALDVPPTSLMPQRELQRLLQVYFMRHGAALGALTAALRFEQIEAVAYNELVMRVQRTLLESVVGVVR